MHHRIVSTLESGNSANDHWDIVIFPFAQIVTGQLAAWVSLHHVRRSRLFGFLGPGQLLSDRERLRIEAVFGPVSSLPTDRPTRETRVVTVEAPFTRAAEDTCALERKRKNIWHNNRRNLVVAQIACALVAGKPDALIPHSLLAAREAERLLLRGQSLGVTVIVESVEHGRRLQAILPGWRLLDTRPRKSGRRQAVAANQIVTYMHAAQRKLDAEVVVWAAAGVLPASLSLRSPTSVLVDVVDDFDAQARDEARERQRQYRQRGWQVDVEHDCLPVRREC